MGLEDTAQERGEQLLQRLRQLNEPEIRGFVSHLLTAAAKERASVLEENRQVAAEEQARAVRDEGARVRDEVEQAWTAKLRETSEAAAERQAEAEQAWTATGEAAAERQAAELREAQKLADRHLSEKVTSVRAEGQRVLEAALEAARDEAERTLTARLDRNREDAERTLVEELAAAAAAVPPPEPPPPPPPVDDVVIRVRDGIRRLDRVSRLTEALDALGSLAAGEASRAAVLTVQDDRVRGWSFMGFESAVDPAHQVDLTLREAGLVGHAVVTGETQLKGPAPAFAALSSDGNAVAVPVVVGGEVMAVLYGDDGESDPAAAWRQSLEILASHAGHCMEALTAARAAQLVGQDVGAMIVEERGPTLPFDDVPGAEFEA
jgi:hypothetical protein